MVLANVVSVELWGFPCISGSGDGGMRDMPSIFRLHMAVIRTGAHDRRSRHKRQCGVAAAQQTILPASFQWTTTMHDGCIYSVE